MRTRAKCTGRSSGRRKSCAHGGVQHKPGPPSLGSPTERGGAGRVGVGGGLRATTQYACLRTRLEAAQMGAHGRPPPCTGGGGLCIPPWQYIYLSMCSPHARRVTAALEHLLAAKWTKWQQGHMGDDPPCGNRRPHALRTKGGDARGHARRRASAQWARRMQDAVREEGLPIPMMVADAQR